jgi:hypothetical protein
MSEIRVATEKSVGQLVSSIQQVYEKIKNNKLKLESSSRLILRKRTNFHRRNEVLVHVRCGWKRWKRWKRMWIVSMEARSLPKYYSTG